MSGVNLIKMDLWDLMASKVENPELISELLKTLENAIPGRYKTTNFWSRKRWFALADARSSRLCVPILYRSAILCVGVHAFYNTIRRTKEKCLKKNSLLKIVADWRNPYTRA